MLIQHHTKGGVKAIIFLLIASTTLLCTLSRSSWGMLVPLQNASASSRAADMKTVQTALESKIVRGRLKTLGLSDQEAQARLNRLSDKQVHQLAKDINTLAPGGDLGLVGIAVVVLIVLLIIWLIRAL